MKRYEELLTTVKKRKLQWYVWSCDKSQWLIENRPSKYSSRWKKRDRQRKKWTHNIAEWTGKSFATTQALVHDRQRWRQLVQRSSMQRPHHPGKGRGDRTACSKPPRACLSARLSQGQLCRGFKSKDDKMVEAADRNVVRSVSPTSVLLPMQTLTSEIAQNANTAIIPQKKQRLPPLNVMYTSWAGIHEGPLSLLKGP